jgi:23S rRNA A1618 N6-methylase RlmF
MESKSKKRSFNTTFSNDLHPLNPYKNNKPDFSKLATKYPDTFGIYVLNNDNNTIDWTNKDALISLSTTLLKEDFNLNLDLLPDRLCPPLPNRLNYLCWLSDIIKLHYIRKNKVINNNSIHILDIGVGSSCIYPLLGYKQFGWKFTGSDIDKKSAENAKKNILNNKNDISDGFITIVEVQPCINIQELINDQILSSLINENNTNKNVEINNTINEFGTLIEEEQVEHEENQMKQKSNESISIQDLLLNHGNIGNPLRGPLRKSLMEMGVSTSTYVLECEQRFFSNTNEGINCVSNEGIEGEILTACMTNPPFYSLEEIVRIYIYILLLFMNSNLLIS